MTNFFTNDDGSAMEASKEAETSGLQPIVPAETKLLVAIAGVTVEPGNEKFKTNEFVKVMLHCVQIGKYKDFTFNHKLHINDSDTKKAERGKKSLLAYDSNCKGELLEFAKQGKNIIDDGVLARALNGGEVIVQLDIWESEDGKSSGNWIRGVYPSAKDNNIEEQAANNNSAIQEQAKPTTMDGFDDDIPF